jgi:histidinol-phosphate/aromatic aminotransferase/cobyric acid decarboxylase-like protein
LLEDDPLDNVLVLDDLSSRLGVPGLRLGYVYSCNRELLRLLEERIPQWNITAPAEFLIELLVKFTKAYSNSIKRTIEDRAELSQALTDVPMVSVVTPSGGNYLLVTLTGSDPSIASDIRRRLLESHRIEVRNVSLQFPDAAPRLLVALRSPKENDCLVSALRAMPVTSGHT